MQPLADGTAGRGFHVLRARKGTAVRTEDRITASARNRSRLKASDSDRERVLDMLKAAFVQGRLTKHEFDARWARRFSPGLSAT